MKYNKYDDHATMNGKEAWYVCVCVIKNVFFYYALRISNFSLICIISACVCVCVCVYIFYVEFHAKPFILSQIFVRRNSLKENENEKKKNKRSTKTL